MDLFLLHFQDELLFDKCVSHGLWEAVQSEVLLVDVIRDHNLERVEELFADRGIPHQVDLLFVDVVLHHQVAVVDLLDRCIHILMHHLDLLPRCLILLCLVFHDVNEGRFQMVTHLTQK